MLIGWWGVTYQWMYRRRLCTPGIEEHLSGAITERGGVRVESPVLTLGGQQGALMGRLDGIGDDD